LRLKADDNIEDKDTRVMRALYYQLLPEISLLEDMRFSLLMRSLRDVYKGEIIVTGDPKIKPMMSVCFMTIIAICMDQSKSSRLLTFFLRRRDLLLKLSQI